MAIRFTNGIGLFLDVGVVDVEFCSSTVHCGRCVWKNWMKCWRTAREPGVPGTRGRRIGERMVPRWMSKDPSELGRLRSVLSERGVYAFVGLERIRICRRRGRRGKSEERR